MTRHRQRDINKLSTTERKQGHLLKKNTKYCCKGLSAFQLLRARGATEALQQIEDKGYARPYEADSRQIRKIGVSFSSKTGTIEEWKEA